MDDQTKLKAYAMRLDGMSWETIADLLHYDRTALARAVSNPAKKDRINRKRRDRYVRRTLG